jgi:hypothetical protein
LCIGGNHCHIKIKKNLKNIIFIRVKSGRWVIKWFQHDSNASHDAKIKKLILRFGAEGYAVYFHCLELIAGDLTQTNINFELEHDAEIIADNLKIKGTDKEAGIDKVNRILKFLIDLKLFTIENNRIFCFKMASRLDNTISRSPEINKIKQLRSNYAVDTKKLGAEENRIHENTIQKNTIDKIRSDKKRFTKPTKEDLLLYAEEIGFQIDPDRFLDYYDSKGWLIGKAPMKDWRAAVRTWKKNNFQDKGQGKTSRQAKEYNEALEVLNARRQENTK